VLDHMQDDNPKDRYSRNLIGYALECINQSNMNIKRLANREFKEIIN